LIYPYLVSKTFFAPHDFIIWIIHESRFLDYHDSLTMGA
jgi:hypothetical protein